MDLVEIRKKAKSRKSKREKAEKDSDKAAVKKAKATIEQIEPETPEASSDADNAQTEIPEGAESRALPEEKARSEKKLEGVSDSMTGLDEVLMSQREEVVEEEEEQLQLLTFKLGDEEYALNIMDIKEIIRPREFTEVPRTPDYILGIFSLRGTIIPVFDVRVRLGLQRGERAPQNRIVVVKSQEHLFGLQVDSVVQVLDIPLSKIEPPPEILGGVEGEFLRGIGRIEDRLIILLNLGRILKLDDEDDSGHLELPSG